MRVHQENISRFALDFREHHSARLLEFFFTCVQSGGDDLDGETSQQPMAILLPGAIGCAAEGPLHAEFPREPRRLIFAFASRSFKIHLLQRHNIWIEAADDSRNACGRQFAVKSHTAMDVVAHHPQTAVLLIIDSSKACFYGGGLAAQSD